MASLLQHILIILYTIYNLTYCVEIITCLNGANACTCDALRIGEECILNCNSDSVCKLATLTCRDNDPCTINCDLKAACRGASITCPANSDCTVNCQSGNNVCTNINSPFVVITNGASSYECIGACLPPSLNVPAPYTANPTPAPTTVTNNPTTATPTTITPTTNNPTTATPTTITPTTNNPTTYYPSDIPTLYLYPTNIPTVEPTYIPTLYPTYYPSAIPTLTMNPTPICPTVFVTVIDAMDAFAAEDFDGVYIYVHQKEIHGRPLWEDPQNPNDKNIHYAGNSYWIINGKNHGFLSYKSNSYFPSHSDNNSNWTHSSVSGIFHVLIKCINSFSPTSTLSNQSTLGTLDVYSEDAPYNTKEPEPNGVVLAVVISLCSLACVLIIVSTVFYWRKRHNQHRYHPGRVM